MAKLIYAKYISRSPFSMDLQYSSDSESDPQEPLKPPPESFLLKYAETPVFRRKGTPTRRTSHISLHIPLSGEQHALLHSLVQKFWNELCRQCVLDESATLQETLFDELTEAARSLHISLSYNLTFENDEKLREFISLLEEKLPLKTPLKVGFSGEIRLLPSLDRSKQFVALMVDQETRNSLRSTVELINDHVPGNRDGDNNIPYSPDLLHCTIGEVHQKDLQFSAHLQPVTLAAASIVASQGRSKTPLHQKQARREKTNAQVG
ncbi:hypothetical protein KL911_000036 [Ogataea haglerorum]|uniref:uncharacterized protein n=1 Tax=Ogataea haglerorum TaxID=1937702 RepID=UPI001C89710D|nr:uncharacterized protein KL911_000036 [Ogataea haglerorum]KAG7758899.1 hypothetical protein KL911_000036 [Ogataea haglerorum]KAG7791399.1 hypothetical protein KL910_001525 [Ogataea haglerorum]KAG7792144.1 hypothetical protein KL945_000425 [Ogataea haglerorum]